jgi:hypothetical protein
MTIVRSSGYHCDRKRGKTLLIIGKRVKTASCMELLPVRRRGKREVNEGNPNGGDT